MLFKSLAKEWSGQMQIKSRFRADEMQEPVVILHERLMVPQQVVVQLDKAAIDWMALFSNRILDDLDFRFVRASCKKLTDSRFDRVGSTTMTAAGVREVN